MFSTFAKHLILIVITLNSLVIPTDSINIYNFTLLEVSQQYLTTESPVIVLLTNAKWYRIWKIYTLKNELKILSY